MTRITATDLARRLFELLNRVEHGAEEFEIERNGQVIARIVPTGKRTTVRGLLEALESVSTDPAFADDLEEIQADQPLLPDDSPWES